MKVAHVVRSDAFAGVERYITLVVPRLAELGCNVTVVGGDEESMRRCLGEIRWLPAISTVDAIRALYSLGRIDIVHAHMTAAELAAVLSKPAHHAKVVSTLHFASRRGASMPGRFARPLSSFLDAQVAVSEFVAEQTQSTHVIQGGVESASRGQSGRTRTVVAVQRLEREKQTDVVLRAWASSSLRDHGWRLQLVGKGSAQEELRTLTSYLQIGESVDWLGFVEDADKILSDAGVLVASTPSEGFGLAVVEAMARATPVIAAGNGAHLETIGPDGWFFPPGDSDACAKLLDLLIVSDTVAYGAYLQARQRALFDIDIHVARLLNLYETLSMEDR